MVAILQHVEDDLLKCDSSLMMQMVLKTRISTSQASFWPSMLNQVAGLDEID
jgi:hypothetical protein